MSDAKIGLSSEKTPKNQQEWKLINTVPYNQPCIVYLGGDGTDNDKKAQHYAKEVRHEVMRTLGRKIPVYSVFYNISDELKEPARQYEYVKHHQEYDENIIQNAKDLPDFQKNPQYIDILYNKLIKKRIMRADNTQLDDADEACRRIRLMTFVTHCHGGYVALKLEEKMQSEMLKLGYTNEERQRIQSQMVILSYAPACPLGISKSQMISFCSAYDYIRYQPSNWFYTYIKKRISEEQKRFMSEKDIKNGGDLKNQYRWFDFHPSFFAQKQGNMFMVKNKFLWDENGGPLIYNDKEHLDVGYTFDDKNSFSGKILISYSRAVLYNVIKNSFEQKHDFEPLPPMEELILPPDRELHEQYRQFFEQMKENGKNFRNETFLYAVSQRKKAPENLWNYRILTTGYTK